MDEGRGLGRCSFLGSWVPPAFEVRRIVVDSGAERAYDEAEWLDAIVVVERGELELECSQGARRRFRRGDVLFLVGLPLRALRSSGRGPRGPRRARQWIRAHDDRGSGRLRHATARDHLTLRARGFLSHGKSTSEAAANYCR